MDLDRLTAEAWKIEPSDVVRLRAVQRSPTGTITAVFYACFAVFACSEELQEAWSTIRGDESACPAIRRLLPGLLRRHVVRLRSLSLQRTPDVLEWVAIELESCPEISSDDLERLLVTLLTYINRIHGWIDRMIPWAALDVNVTLLESAGARA